jgi:hypothetical protein
VPIACQVELAVGLQKKKKQQINLEVAYIVHSLCPQNSTPVISLGEKCVPIMFPKTFHKVSLVPIKFPNVFPKVFPIAPGFYPIWFAQSSTPLYVNKKDEFIVYICFYFATGGPKRCFNWGACPIFPKKLLMGQSIWLL